MADHYLEDRARLKGQPKRTVADYVEQNGILVPKRFSSLKESRASGMPVFVRSEHPMEYAEVSGFFDSFLLSYIDEGGEVKDENDLKQKVLREGAVKQCTLSKKFHFISHFFIANYCSLLGIDPKKPIEDLSFSFWEKLGGRNRTVVADSSIKGRYHITDFFSQGIGKDNDWYFTYAVVEDEKVVLKDVRSKTPVKDEFEDTIKLYEDCRNLPHFDKDNCPIIEMQKVDGKLYFLQHHRGRKFNPAGFELTRSPEDGEKEVMFVRGHTPRQGFSGKVTTCYADASTKNFDEWRLPKKEFGSLDSHYNLAFSTIMNPRRRLRIIHPSYKGDLGWELFKYSAHHSQISELFVPEVSIIPDNDLFRNPHSEKRALNHEEYMERELYQHAKKARETGQDSYVKLRVVSDGRRAFIKRLD